MTKVFIIRPFGKKRVTVPNVQGDDTLVEVDFDKIDQDLIQAALDKNNLKGETTELIASAGNTQVAWHYFWHAPWPDVRSPIPARFTLSPLRKMLDG
jgi:hypothetical protein